MSFFKKHEFLFGLGLIIFFTLPFILQLFGVINFISLEQEVFILVLMIIVAFIPSVIWIKIFNKEHPEAKSALIVSFLAGCTSTIPIFFYQDLFLSGKTGNFIFFKAQAVNFQQNISEIFGYPSLSMLTDAASSGAYKAALGVFAVFMGVGVLEEIVKHVVINKRAAKYLAFISFIVAIVFLFKDFSLKNIFFIGGLIFIYLAFLRLLMSFLKIRSIDDAIEIAIVGALGFAFIENIHYFTGKFDSIPMGTFLFFVVVRLTIVTVVHVLCSGILGYHVGIAHFAHPVLQDEMREGRKMLFVKFFHNLFRLPKDTIFEVEQVFIGLLYAIGVHALYDFFMQLKFTIFGIPAFALIMPIYFIGGLWYLFDLLDKKEDQKNLGKLVIKQVYKVNEQVYKVNE